MQMLQNAFLQTLARTEYANARLYLRPTGFVDGRYLDLERVQRLCGGSCFFSQLHVMARSTSQPARQPVAGTFIGVHEADIFLASLPPPVQAQADAQWAALCRDTPTLLGTRLDRPRLLGILNLTPDSFFDGGQCTTPEKALAAAHAMMAQGAWMIDVGAESTRPKAALVPAEQEWARLEPVLKLLTANALPLSLDTRKAVIMQRGLEAGVKMINDVSALSYEAESIDVVAQTNAPVVLMHARGDPATMQDNPHYADVLLDVYDVLADHVARCVRAGIAKTRLIVDPGIGFGKNLRHNLRLLNGLSLFHTLGCPLLLGASRKRFIGALSREEAAEARLAGSIAALLQGASQGVQLLRVHDVGESAQALSVWQGLRDSASLPEG
jgi:dihydropteroate synthase